jgi:hypothetical protein
MGLGSWLFGDDESQSTNTTSSSNSSDTFSSTDSHNVATNTSNNSTSNNTNTLTQDRRLVTDHGVGVTADNSSVFTTDSGNSWLSTITSDTKNYTTTNTVTDFGAVQAVVASNTSLAGRSFDVSSALARTGAEMMSANLDFLQHINDTSQSAARSAISEVVTATGNALNQVVGIASKPLNANDPQRLVIIVGLCVVGLVFFSKK